MTPSEIEPATFLLVAQCLNQLRHQQRATYPRDTFLKFDHIISPIPTVRAAITDLRIVTVGKRLSQWEDISVLFEYSFKTFIYEARLKHSRFGGNSLLSYNLEDRICNKGIWGMITVGWIKIRDNTYVTLYVLAFNLNSWATYTAGMY